MSKAQKRRWIVRLAVVVILISAAIARAIVGLVSDWAGVAVLLAILLVWIGGDAWAARADDQ